MNNNKYYAAVLIYAAYMMFGMSWAATGSMMVSIIRDLHLSVAQSSFLTTSVSMAKIVGALSASLFLARLGLKRTFQLGSILIGVSVLSGLSHTVVALLFVRFVMGFGSAICLVCLVPLVQGLFAPHLRARMNGINATSNIVGTILALSASYLIAQHLSWRLTLSLYGAVSVLIALLWSSARHPSLLAPLSSVAQRSGSWSVFRAALQHHMTWGMVLVYIFPISFLTVSFTYTPLYLRAYRHVVPGSLGDWMPAIMNLGILLGPFISTWLLKRQMALKLILAAGLLMALLCGLGSLWLGNLYGVLLLALLSGVGIGLIIPVFFNLPSYMAHSTPAQTGYVMSLFWSATYVLSTLNTWVMGLLVDLTHGFGWSFAYMFVLSVPSLLGLLWLPISWRLQQAQGQAPELK